MSSSRPRILLVAHHCNPEWGSEPLIGWHQARSLAERTDVTVVTHVRNRPALERRTDLRATVEYVDTERLAKRIQTWNDRLWKGGGVTNRMFLDTVTQRAFDREAVRIARRLVDAGRIDSIQRVSPISPRYPTKLGQLGVPFVLGPVNGGLRTAPGFPEIDRRERTRFLALRGLARVLDPFRTTLHTASAVLAANRHTLDMLPFGVRRKAEVLSENAVEIERFEPRFERRGERLRILYCGRLIPLKGVDFLIRGLAGWSATTDFLLDVVGDGPERARLEALSNSFGLGERIRFHGHVAVEVIPGFMRGCDVLCLPSVRESGGGVVLEAMACGKPAVVLDHGGPPELVGTDAGICVQADSDQTLVAGLAAALGALADDEPRRRACGEAARARVERHYTWTAKSWQELRLHCSLTGKALPAPDDVPTETAMPRRDADALAGVK